ncbi:MAG: SUMF1/EgtB/PvdO family nonheme iron enzyme [Desulfovibrionaceae bacterium]
MSFLTLLLAVLLLGAQAHAANGAWIDLPGDDPDTVKAAIAAEVDTYAHLDSQGEADEAMRTAKSDAQNLSRQAQENISALKTTLSRTKRKRDEFSELVTQLTERRDALAVNLANTQKSLAATTRQLEECKQEIVNQETVQKRRLEDESVGDVVTVAIFEIKDFHGPTQKEMEHRADVMASQKAVDELLNHIESTTLIQRGMVTRDSIINRRAGQSKPQATKQTYANGRYVRLKRFGLFPLQEPLDRSTATANDGGVKAAVVRDMGALRAFLKGAGLADKTIDQVVKEQGVADMLASADANTRDAQGIIQDFMEIQESKMRQLRLKKDELTEAIVRLGEEGKSRQDKLAKAEADLASESRTLARQDTQANTAQTELDKAVKAFRSYTFRNKKAPVGWERNLATNAIDLILATLDTVRADAKQHLADTTTRVENGKLASHTEQSGHLSARIRRFRLAYVKDVPGVGERELEIGVLFETEAADTGSEAPSGKTWTDPATGMEFVWVPGGCFRMGSPASEKDRDNDEGPVHDVCVDGFWMGKYEVTNAQYRAFKSGHDSKMFNGHSLNGQDQPVVSVSWEDATAYAAWLSGKGNGRFRLPTEAEWEYAARAGTESARYWGDDPGQACGYANVADRTAKRQWSGWTMHDCDDGYAVTAPVDRFRPNAFGLYDMLGNVWEWCQDWYGDGYYASSPRSNPTGAGGGSDRVLRGGSWANGPGYVRSANRSRGTPSDAYDGLGFRLLRTN